MKTQLEAVMSPYKVYDGMVPGKVPTDSLGSVLPYAAMWPRPLYEHPEQSVAYCDPETASTLEISAVGATPGTVRNVSQGIIRALHRVTAPGGGEYRHTEPHLPIRFDNQVTPGRYYQPLTFSFLQP